ncbi:MAG: diacylglycerol kinase family protein [Candidatus Wallbacteria bacterium]|nr:diacylglycerol kinase family protein [Candidatus Wallbacteria bacterium]
MGLNHLFFYNPCSGGIAGKLDQINYLVKDFQAQLLETDPDPRIFFDKYQKLVTGNTILTAIGGDGTLNLLVNSFYPYCRNYSLIPVGTANVVAGELGIPTDIKKAFLSLKNPSPIGLDLARVNQSYFLMSLGIGMDAESVGSVSVRLKKLSGRAAYLHSFLKTFLCYREPVLRINTGGKTYHAYSLIVQNFRNYAGPFHFSNKVSPHDGLLNLVLFLKPHWGIFRLSPLFQIIFGQSKWIRIIPVVNARIDSDQQVRTQIDGDSGPVTPIEVEVIPQALHFFLGSEILLAREKKGVFSQPCLFRPSEV